MYDAIIYLIVPDKPGILITTYLRMLLKLGLLSTGSSLTLQLGGAAEFIVGGQRVCGNSFLGVEALLTGLVSSRASSGHR